MKLGQCPAVSEAACDTSEPNGTFARRFRPVAATMGSIMKYQNFKELRQKLGGRGRTTVYRDIELGRLPRPIKLGGRLYWIDSQVDEVVCGEPHESASSSRPIRPDGGNDPRRSKGHPDPALSLNRQVKLS